MRRNVLALFVVCMIVGFSLLSVLYAFTERPDQSANVPFTFNPALVNYPIDAWDTAEPNSLYTRIFDVWLPQDTVEVTTITHGTIDRTVVVDPNGSKTSTYNWTYVTPNTEGVVYIDAVSATTRPDPNDNRTKGRTFLLNVKKKPPEPIIRFRPVGLAPIGWFWKVDEIARHPDVYMPTLTSNQFQKEWIKLNKLIKGMTPQEAEQTLISNNISTPPYIEKTP